MSEPAPVACLRCGMQDPPPEPSCTGDRDHFIGTDTEQGCAGCGRLAEACSRRPCSTRRRTQRRGPLRGQADGMMEP